MLEEKIGREVFDYLNNFFKGTKNPTLDGIKFFMNEFGNVHNDLKFIHIAGTNGKGSCSEMLNNILIKAGYRVGKFISPHLINYNERICVNNKDISNRELLDLINELNPIINKYSDMGNKATLFEIETCMALLYFYRNNCDIVVLETGLGGTYDCTNIVNPLVSIISSIGYDHMHILGNTLEEIALNKAGIIKENSNTVFCLNESDGVNEIIKNTCLEKNNNLHLISSSDIKNYSYDSKFLKFDYKNHSNILVNLLGEKQLYNASICIECCDIINTLGFNISEDNIRDGLKSVIHRARFETISVDPLIIYDGAHNEAAIDNFINSCDMYYKDETKVFIISILKTKDYKMVLKKLLSVSNSIFLFTSGNDIDRYVSSNELLNEALKYRDNDLYSIDLEESIDLIRNKYSNCVNFFVGSFYVYGDVINLVNNV